MDPRKEVDVRWTEVREERREPNFKTAFIFVHIKFTDKYHLDYDCQ